MLAARLLSEGSGAKFGMVAETKACAAAKPHSQQPNEPRRVTSARPFRPLSASRALEVPRASGGIRNRPRQSEREELLLEGVEQYQAAMG